MKGFALVFALVSRSLSWPVSQVRTMKAAYTRYYQRGLAYWFQAGGSFWHYIKLVHAEQTGMAVVDTLIYVFIAFVILYQLIPWISDQNAAVQTSGNVSEMGKFSAGLGEWMFPLFGVLVLGFLIWKKRGMKGT